MRHLCLILGDQLDRASRLFVQFDAKQDRLWMAEVAEEATHVKSHKQRIALFLSAMRHFAAKLQAQSLPLDYFKLDEHEFANFADALSHSLQQHQPDSVRVVRPGDYRVLQQIKQVCKQHQLRLDVLHDQHFLSDLSTFRDWAADRKQLRMEYWYRELRKQHQILMDDAGKPVGGKWNYDQDNRKAFDKHGPESLPPAPNFVADEITQAVISLVKQRFVDHAGELDALHWAVTPTQAEQLLQRFLDQALPQFGDYQDAMWTGEAFLNHSLLSAALNLKLLHPLTVIQQAEQRYDQGLAPLAAVEGFIRQILGWREYVRGLYWLHMPQWLDWNSLQADQNLPNFYWTGDTEMTCLQQSIRQTLQHGYAHHIQRLMVTGLFALLYGVDPKQVHQWYLAVYVDAVEWVELPNTLGMSQYADGGLMASKPYAASGQYINKMSNYCKHCQYKPAQATGNKACPITTLFWDFLQRHQTTLSSNPRMGFMLKHLQKKSPETLEHIRQQAAAFRSRCSESSS